MFGAQPGDRPVPVEQAGRPRRRMIGRLDEAGEQLTAGIERGTRHPRATDQPRDPTRPRRDGIVLGSAPLFGEQAQQIVEPVAIRTDCGFDQVGVGQFVQQSRGGVLVTADQRRRRATAEVGPRHQRQQREQLPGPRPQQVVGHLDRLLHTLVAGGHLAQQAAAVTHPVDGRRQRPIRPAGQSVGDDPNGQRQVSAQPYQRAGRQRLGVGPLRAHDPFQQPHSVVRGQLTQHQPAGDAEAEQPLAAGDQGAQRVPPGSNGNTWCSFTDVVQHHEHGPVPRHRPEAVGARRRTVGNVPIGEAERAQHPGQRLGRLGRMLVGAVQIHEQAAVGKPVTEQPCGPHHQRRLAGTRFPDHGGHSGVRLAGDRAQFTEFRFPADEVRRFRRHSASRRGHGVGTRLLAARREELRLFRSAQAEYRSQRQCRVLPRLPAAALQIAERPDGDPDSVGQLLLRQPGT